MQAVVDHHHIDVKTATKVRFQEPNSQQPNGIDETQDKSATQDSADAVESNEKVEDAVDNKSASGGSPKPDAKEKSDKETKENDTSGSTTKKPNTP